MEQTERQLVSLLSEITPLYDVPMREAKARQDALAKPPGSLGLLEDLSVQLAGRAGAALGQLTAHGWLGDVLARQKPPRRTAVGLQHGKQQVPGIRPGTAHAARKLHGFVQQQPCLPGEPFVSALAECFPNAHVLPLPPFWYPAEV